MKPSKWSYNFNPHIKSLGQVDYAATERAMREFTTRRIEKNQNQNQNQNDTDNTPDEIWILEHPPVFTLGKHADPNHFLIPPAQITPQIPIIQTDRGGQVTYHGPGQLIIYFLLDLKKLNIGPKILVCNIEKSIIKLLKKDFNIPAELKANAPGVYVFGEKIASIGLRIKNGCSYHGLSLNINMDLKPFGYINPCGYSDLKMTTLANVLNNLNLARLDSLNIAKKIISYFSEYCLACSSA